MLGGTLLYAFGFHLVVRDSNWVSTFSACEPVLREERPGTLGDVQPPGCQNALSLDARYVGNV